MSGNATTTATPQTSYGSAAVSNRVRPGGSLGSGQYYPIVDASTGRIDVYRYTPQRGGSVKTQIGSIPRGGNFTPTTQSNSAEILHFSSNTGRQQFRDNARQVVTRQWDGRSQPPPNTIINGANSLQAAYGGPGSASGATQGNQDTWPQGSQTAATTDQQRLQQLDRALTQPGRPNTSLGSGQTLVYPVTIRQQEQDHLKIKMVAYKPKEMGFKASGDLSGVGSRQKNRKGLGTVILPIPGGISDTNAVSWGGEQMDPLAAGTADAAYATIMKGVRAGADKVGDAFEQIKQNSEDVKTGLGAAIAGMASGTGKQILQRTEGAIINPNMELLFNNPTLRPFTFNWKLAARSSNEAKEILKIIRFFKQGMAPIRQAPNLFLKSPNTFQLTYKHKGRDHKAINLIKECALQTFTTAYTPDGNYATFEDGVMTSYQITMNFTELEPVYSDDYDEIGTDQLGF